MENLPLNYSRIFQFQSFERTRRRTLAEAAMEEEGAMVKWVTDSCYNLDLGTAWLWRRITAVIRRLTVRFPAPPENVSNVTAKMCVNLLAA